ncbi:LPS translocon maturation chaperone LptM [Oceanospirillum maris]|nr:lipoprotein [Oceanospirillum maris]
MGRQMKAILSVCLLALVLVGCGQKGPLYLPEPEPASVPAVMQIP